MVLKNFGFTIDGQYLSYLQSEGKYLNGKREGVEIILLQATEK